MPGLMRGGRLNILFCFFGVGAAACASGPSHRQFRCPSLGVVTNLESRVSGPRGSFTSLQVK